MQKQKSKVWDCYLSSRLYLSWEAVAGDRSDIEGGVALPSCEPLVCDQEPTINRWRTGLQQYCPMKLLIEVQVLAVTTYSHVILFSMQHSSSRSCCCEILPSRILLEVLQNEAEQGSPYSQWSFAGTAGKAGALSSSCCSWCLSPSAQPWAAQHECSPWALESAWR